MDTAIVATAIGSFFLFLVIHVIILRSVENAAVMEWLVKSFFIAGGLGMAAAVLLGFPLVPVLPSVLAAVLYALLTVTFILAIFGITVTSLRIQILTRISESGDAGLTYGELIKRYGRTAIVETRLMRMTESGDLVVQSGRYSWSGKVSFFFLFTQFLLFLNALYKTAAYGNR